MLKIGDFSKLSRVSVRMLRHYDEIGLLAPEKVDGFTGYRYYGEEQLPTVYRINALKEMGFSLADIREILLIYNDRERLDGYLSAREDELRALAGVTAHRMRLLETARKRLRKEENMTYNVNVKTISQRYAACVRMILPRYEDEGLAWQTLLNETEAQHPIADNPCLCCAVFLDGEYKESNVEIEVQKTVKGSYTDTEHVRFRTLPAVTVASCILRGSYDQMNDVYAAMTSWITSNGYEYAGAMFNIYHVSPHETGNPEEFVTEVCYPVRKK